MVIDVAKFLNRKEAESADRPMAEQWSQLEDLYSKRLWHQLTVRLLEFCRRDELQKAPALVELYENFIKDIEMRINPLSYMELLVLIVKQMEADQALEFLDKAEPKLKSSKEATALCLLTKGEVQLLKKHDTQGAKDTLEKVDEILRGYDGVSTVHGRFYLLESELHHQRNATADYYRSALKFLGCTNINTLQLDDQKKHATALAVAALVGEGIYNFGELLAHPVLNSLKRTSKEWLVDLMRAFNSGDIDAFKKLEPHIKTIPELEKNKEALRVKVILLCLMEMTFKRPSFERQLTFQEIMDKTSLSSSEVELYVMKAVAKGLVKGRIDQVGEKVLMTWVQPRVLDRNQIGGMITRLDSWHTMIRGVEDMVEKNAADILL